MTLPTFGQAQGKVGHNQYEGTAKLGSQEPRSIHRVDTGKKMTLKVKADLAGMAPFLPHSCFGLVVCHRGCFTDPCSGLYICDPL